MSNLLGRGLHYAVPSALLLLWTAGPAAAQSVSLNIAPTGGESFTTNVVGILALTSVLAIAPGLLMIGTSFTRLVIVLSLLRTALGLQQTPPNTVIMSLALILTGTIMAPSFEAAYHDALQPLMNGAITEEQALDRGVRPFRSFMEANTNDKDLALFIDLAGWKPPEHAATDHDTATESQSITATHPAKPGSVARATRTAMPLHILCSAFVTSELSKAFQIGFLLFLPFLVIDMAVSAILMGMGMMMLPPVVVSLPFKLIFFVLVSGWELVAGSLVRSFAG
ncbi:MAG: flagellar type III secretion system pore protein FliP [Alphaproteobacteria bacterium]|nr:flagellar type III secretion system pore protein FliP [Alphaproteobacteria bacterium]